MSEKDTPRVEEIEGDVDAPILEVVDEESLEVISSQVMPGGLLPLRKDKETGEYNRAIPHISDVAKKQKEMKKARKARKTKEASTLDEQMEIAREQYEEVFQIPLGRPARRAAKRDQKLGGVGYTKKRRGSR